MEIKLVFFDSAEQSKNGTIRGLVAFIIIALVCVLWYGYIFQSWKKYVDLQSRDLLIGSAIVMVFLIASAISVGQPDSDILAVVYGTLVGLVIFGTGNALYVALQPYPISMALIDTTFGAVLCGLTSWVVFRLFRQL